MEPTASIITPEMLGVQAELNWYGGVDARLVLTGALIVLMLATRWLVVSLVHRRATFLSDVDRRRIAFARNGTSIAILLGLLGLWSPELSEFALSLTAFAVAIVIATKELIMCFAGGVVRGLSGSFASGDWIEIGPHSGEVVEQTLVTTTLMEVDREDFTMTGRSVTVPNAIFLTQPVVNHRHRRRFIHHEFSITTEMHPDAPLAQEAIRAALDDASAEFRELAERYAQFIEARLTIDLPEVCPEVHIRSTEGGKVRFLCRLFCPRERAAEMEGLATAAYYAWVDAQDWHFFTIVRKA
ncbi:mechanosensitive ion channel family protein [Rhodovulum sp. DZ06]|uniref:mechanosensitive ion channel family protein n=1 Tax=Rhodovulum sp. DZ06 TaxID=3425126 RepID=UPI003D351797